MDGQDEDEWLTPYHEWRATVDEDGHYSFAVAPCVVRRLERDLFGKPVLTFPDHALTAHKLAQIRFRYFALRPAISYCRLPPVIASRRSHA
jgi:hypothetical protein